MTHIVLQTLQWTRVNVFVEDTLESTVKIMVRIRFFYPSQQNHQKISKEERVCYFHQFIHFIFFQQRSGITDLDECVYINNSTTSKKLLKNLLFFKESSFLFVALSYTVAALLMSF